MADERTPTQYQTELTSTPLSYAAPPLSYGAPYGATLDAAELRSAPITGYAVANLSTFDPTELRRTTTELPCTPLSYAASYGAIPCTPLSYAAYPRYVAERKYENVMSCTLIDTLWYKHTQASR